MASLNDYKRHIQVLKMEQKIGRIQNELETVDYGDECPLHGENDCAEVRKAYDRGYVSGLYEAMTLFKLIEADAPQTDLSAEEFVEGMKNLKMEVKQTDCDRYVIVNDEGERAYNCIGCQTDCPWK